MPQVEDDKIVESATEARGAVTGQNVKFVLFAVAYLATQG